MTSASTVDSTIEVSINGTSIQLAATTTVADLVAARGLAGKRIAVERNGEIVPRSRHAATRLALSDRIEIVVAVGGG
ncbi:sulfur carrier protein ThiS [soil metagenome]